MFENVCAELQSVKVMDNLQRNVNGTYWSQRLTDIWHMSGGLLLSLEKQ